MSALGVKLIPALEGQPLELLPVIEKTWRLVLFRMAGGLFLAKWGETPAT